MDCNPPQRIVPWTYIRICNKVIFKNLTRKDIKTIIKLQILDKSSRVYTDCVGIERSWESTMNFLRGLK